MTKLLKGARIIDPSQNMDAIADLLIEDGKVAAIGEGLSGDEVIECTGLVLSPGLIDLHVHLREPGQEYKEDIESGTMAAAAGGVTGVVCMPNTVPPIDDPVIVRGILQRAAEVGKARVYPAAAVTRNLQDEGLTDMAALKQAGAVAVTDDAHPLALAGVLRRACEYAQMFKLPVMLHCEDKTLSGEGYMNEGYTSTEIGLRGMPAIAEDIHVSRNCMMSMFTGAHVHMLHVSSAFSVDLIRKAKARGANVTAETCPHYFTLTDEACAGYDTNFKMNPPLRDEASRLAVLEGLLDGTIDAISTDHAPHAKMEKDKEFGYAPFGVVGLETSFAVSYTYLVKTGKMSLMELINKMSTTPARIIGVPGGSLKVGCVADIALFDINHEWTVDPDQFYSKSQNTTFKGWPLTGRAVHTLLGGETVYQLR
ncbi:MAG: dihydroorotase [Armatimonadota bacterium]